MKCYTALPKVESPYDNWAGLWSTGPAQPFFPGEKMNGDPDEEAELDIPAECPACGAEVQLGYDYFCPACDEPL